MIPHPTHYKLQFQTVYQDEFLIAEVDAAYSLMYVRWYRHPNSQEFRGLFTMLVDLLLQHKLKYWFSESIALQYLEFSDQNWLLNQVLPMLRNTCLKKYARLTTKERMTLMDMARIVEGIDRDPVLSGPVEFQEFFSVEDALDWLLDTELQ